MTNFVSTAVRTSNATKNVTFEVPVVVAVEGAIRVIPLFGETSVFHLLFLVSCIAYSSTLKMEAICFFETLSCLRTTRRFFPKDNQRNNEQKRWEDWREGARKKGTVCKQINNLCINCKRYPAWNDKRGWLRTVKFKGLGRRMYISRY